MTVLTSLYIYLFHFNYWRFSLIVMSAYPKDLCVMLISFIGLKQMLSDAKFRRIIYPFILYTFIVSNISAFYLFGVKSITMAELFKRLIIQGSRFLMLVIEIYIGYSILLYIKPKALMNGLFLVIKVLALAGLYQFVAFHVGLPYWGITMKHSYIAPSIKYGIRPNSFVGEPKVYSAFLAISFTYLYYMNKYKKISLLNYIFWFAILLFLFARTESGNGFLSIMVLVAFRFLISNVNYYIKFTIMSILLYGFVSILSDPAEYFSRNLKVLNAISNLDYLSALYSMDDLVLLPTMALMNNLWALFSGFGYGLLTFYARDFLSYGEWVSPTQNIDSNIQIISFISNFGMIIVIIFTSLMIKKNKLITKVCMDTDVIVLAEYFLNCFFVGLFVTGNTTLLWFAIGFYMRKLDDYPENEEIENKGSE